MASAKLFVSHANATNNIHHIKREIKANIKEKTTTNTAVQKVARYIDRN